MTALENKCLYQAQRLHEAVVYGGGLVMLDQIKATVALVQKHSQLTGDRKETVVCATLLHKSFEEKRIAEGVLPLTMDQVEHLAGLKVRSVVSELAGEPEDETKIKTEQWREKAEWAKGLSLEAQEILLAEKVVNFEVSRDRPNPKKPMSWHKEYYETRMLMVDALKEVNPTLFRLAVQTKNEGLHKIAFMQKNLSQEGNSL